MKCQRYNAVCISYTLRVIAPYHDRSAIELAPVKVYRLGRVLDVMLRSAQTEAQRLSQHLQGIRPDGRSGKNERGLGRPTGAILLPVAGQRRVSFGL